MAPFGWSVRLCGANVRCHDGLSSFDSPPPDFSLRAMPPALPAHSWPFRWDQPGQPERSFPLPMALTQELASDPKQDE